MSKAIKCDRCGLFFVPDDTHGEYIHIDEILYKNVRFGADNQNVCVRQETFGDICHKCTLEFKRFCSRVETVDKKLFDDLRKDYDDLMADYEAILKNNYPDVTDGQICHIHTEDEE